MSSFFAIVDPEQRTNLVCNPSAETTGNYAPLAATVTMAYDQARYGIRAYKVAMGGTSQGLFAFMTTAANTTHYASWYAWATTATMRCTANSGTNWNSASVIGGKTGGWVRYGVALPPAQTSNSPYLGVISAENVGTLYIDAIQCEAGSYPTTYLDGDMPGLYRWNGLRHGSSSTRDAQERSGGKEADLSDDYGISVNPSFSGVGMPPVKLNLQNMALQPGALLQSIKTLPREIVLDLNINATTNASWVSLHQRRQQLINLVKPDRVRGAQPFTLVYKGTDRGGGASPLYAKFVYADGLGFGNIQKGFLDTPQVRCVAVDPAWYEDNQQTQILTPQIEVANANHIIQNANGTWQAMGTGTTGGIVWAMTLGKDNTVYVGGAFSTAGGVANTIGIAKWNGTTWGAVGTGASTGTVRALATAPDGSIYSGGDYAVMGGVVNTTGISKWSGTAWSALGFGITTGTAVYDIAIDSNALVYTVGYFTRMGGVANTINIAKWDGTAWSALGAGTNDQVGAVCRLSNDNILAGGNFNTAGTVLSPLVAKWNGTAWEALNSGLTGTFVYSITTRQDDTAYISGLITSIRGGETCNDAISWNGSMFANLNSDALGSTVIRKLKVLDGNLYLFGDTTSVGKMTVPQGAVIFNGSTFVPLDISLPGAPTYYSALSDGRGNQYFGFDTVGTAICSALTNVVPSATEAVFPKLIVVGPTTAGTTAWIQRIENRSTNERLYMNYFIQGGETLTIDCSQSKKTVSSDWRGEITGQPLSGSDLSAFHLLPTTNSLSLFILGRAGTTSGLSAIMQYTPAHWSIDGNA